MGGFQKHFLIILGTLFLVCVWYLFSEKPHINDGEEYYAAANNLLENNRLYAGGFDEEIDYRLYSKRTLGYPVYLIFQNTSATITLFSSIGLVVLNFFLGIQLLSHFQTKKRGFGLFVLLFSLHIPILLHASFPLSDLLLCAVITTSVAVFYDSKNSARSKLIALGCLWGFGLLLKPVLLPSVLFSPIVFLYFKLRKGRGSIALLFPLFIYLSGSGVNYMNTNQYEYSSISTINLGQYNAKLTVAKAFGYDSAQEYVSRSEFAIPRTSKEYANYRSKVNSLAKSTILDNLKSYITVHTAGSIKMLLDPGRFELYTFFNQPTSDGSLTEMIYAQRWSDIKAVLIKTPVLFVLIIGLFLLAIVKLIGAAFSVAQFKKLSFILIITAYFVIIAGPVGAARFMLPVSVIYLVLACQGIDSILHSLQKSTKGK